MIIDDEMCQEILELTERNAGMSHQAWDMLDPLETIAVIVMYADQLRGIKHETL
jgi:hypothetical protein